MGFCDFLQKKESKYWPLAEGEARWYGLLKLTFCFDGYKNLSRVGTRKAFPNPKKKPYCCTRPVDQ